VAFKHLFLKGSEDVANDTQAIYTRRDLLEHLAFILEKVAQGHQSGWGHQAGGGTRLWLCQHFFCRGYINPSNNTFDTFNNI
ncbi:MCLN3 protein, partial [Dicaeum eximium]|nr:MCLN3 protein [Dicaeum eximium]